MDNVHHPLNDFDSSWKEVDSLNEVAPHSRMDIRRAGNVWATGIDFDCDLMAVNSQFYDHALRFCVGNKQNVT